MKAFSNIKKELINTLKNNMEIDRKGSLQPDTCVYIWQRAIGVVQVYFETKDKRTAPRGNLSFFDGVVQERTDMIHNILSMKAKEYASKTDRFHNFRVAARKMNTTPEIALQGMMAKHEVAVLDMIKNPENATIRMIEEKIGDHINYLILLEGLLKERHQS